jgi:hypothetical protein
MTEDLKNPSHQKATYCESIQLAKLTDEAERAIWKHEKLRGVQYVWYHIAKNLEKRGLCRITETLNQHGRIKWRIITPDGSIDPSETKYRNVRFHQRIVSLRRFLLDTYNCQADKGGTKPT